MSESTRFLLLAEPVLRATAELRPRPGPPLPGAVAAARRAYLLRLWLRVGSQRCGLLVPTPYHTPAHRGWSPAPVALAGPVHAPPGAAARWRVAWARGAGDELAVLVQGLIDRDQGGLARELGAVLQAALREHGSVPLARQRAAAWLQSWMISEDIGIDEVGFATVAAGLAPQARAPVELIADALELPADQAREGDLALDRGGSALGVVERGPRRVGLGAVGSPVRRALLARLLALRGEEPELLELEIAHALPGEDVARGPRLTRLWLSARDLHPLHDEEGAGFCAFYRPRRGGEPARARGATSSSPPP